MLPLGITPPHDPGGFLQRSSLAMLRATPRGNAAAGSSALQVLRAGAASEAQRALIQRLEMMEQVKRPKLQGYSVFFFGF